MFVAFSLYNDNHANSDLATELLLCIKHGSKPFTQIISFIHNSNLRGRYIYNHHYFICEDTEDL